MWKYVGIIEFIQFWEIYQWKANFHKKGRKLRKITYYHVYRVIVEDYIQNSSRNYLLFPKCTNFLQPYHIKHAKIWINFAAVATSRSWFRISDSRRGFRLFSRFSRFPSLTPKLRSWTAANPMSCWKFSLLLLFYILFSIFSILLFMNVI